MEQAFLRFPHLSENIFDLLDNKSLADCKEVSKAWYFYLDAQTFLQPRIIKANQIKYIETAIEEIQTDFRQWLNGFDQGNLLSDILNWSGATASPVDIKF
jgi:hypothetical protein